MPARGFGFANSASEAKIVKLGDGKSKILRE